MRTTIDIPADLMNRALRVTGSRTKTDLIKLALANIIQQNSIQNLKACRGTVDLEIDLKALRKRK